MHDHHDEHGHDQAHSHESHGRKHNQMTQGLPGHNRPQAAQWQVPHLPGAAHPTPSTERDLDLVETSFVEGFGRASDPTSFLRLAGIPFVGLDGTGRRLHLLRVEMESLTDLGAISPLLNGAGMRYDPLPARMVSQRRRLAFVYHDDRQLLRLSFAEARLLADETAASQFSISCEC